MKNSIWTNYTLPDFPVLENNIKTDVLIIGGGICGLLCGHMLKRKGVDCIIAEGSKIASGITRNTTAKLTLGHSLIYHKLIRNAGKEKAQMYLDANLRALKEYENLCTEINCDYERKNAYTYSITDRRKIENEITALNSLGVNALFETGLEIPLKTVGAVCIRDQAQFHPLKFISEITKDLNIYENTFVKKISGNQAKTAMHTITAEKIIVATHFPFINKYGFYFIKLYQHRSYVSAYEGIPHINGMYVDENLKGLSFRSYGDLTLIGGGGHRTGKKGMAWRAADEFVKEHCPDAKLKYQWSAQDTMSPDSVPYIGLYSSGTPDLYVASGFNKWGFTSSMVAATILCDAILGKKNECAEVFTPQRSILKPQVMLNGAEAVLNLLTPTPKRCPHLGCALKWNKAEHTWDCPCHGSRFDKNGKLIDNPAKKGLGNRN